MNFKNMKIRKKLMCSFLIVAFITAIVGGLGTFGMFLLNNNGEALYREGVESLTGVNGMYAVIVEQRLELRGLIIYIDDAERVADTIDKLRAREDEFQELYELYRAGSTGTDEKENELIIKVLGIYDGEFRNLKEQMIAALHADDKAMARKIFEQVGVVAEEATEALYQMVLYGNEWAEAINHENNQTANSFITLSCILTVLAVFCAVFLGVFNAKIIAKPITGIAGAAQKLSVGDLDIGISANTNDEIGEMAKAFEAVIAALRALNDDAGMLMGAAEKGQLSVRADANKHLGSYRKIIEGINNTLDLVTIPIHAASDVLAEMAKGNLQTSVDGHFEGDHAIIKNAVNETMANMRAYISEIGDKVVAIAGGNFDIEITMDFMGDFVALKNAISEIANSLSSVMKEISTAADQVSVGSHQVSDAAQNVSQGATEQAASIEELTATITEIADQVKHTSKNVHDANETVLEAKHCATEGTEQMMQMQQAIDDINTSSTSISRIIKVIDDIAFQTNILALNAAVEAARAGANGKGFAVVAEEVRNLAAKSADAVKETTDLIEGSIKKAKIGTQIVNETAETLSKMTKMVETIVEALGTIAVASNEQTSGIVQINIGIEQMSEVVQNNSATAEEAAASAQELSGQAGLLQQMVGQFKLKGENGQIRMLSNALEIPRRTINLEPHGNDDTKIILNDSDFGKY